MKHIAPLRGAAVLAVAAGLLLAGCVPPMFRIPPGGPRRGFISTVTYPNSQQGTNTNRVVYSPVEIELHGWVERGRESFNVYGNLPGVGGANLVGAASSDYNSTYVGLLREHRLDGLVSSVVDTRIWKLDLIIVRFTRQRTYVGGMGFRLRGEHRGYGSPLDPRMTTTTLTSRPAEGS